MYPKILAFKTNGKKQELMSVAMMIITKLASYSLDLVTGFMKWIINSTIKTRMMLLKAEATDDTMSNALFIKMVLFTDPHALTMAVSDERIFY